MPRKTKLPPQKKRTTPPRIIDSIAKDAVRENPQAKQLLSTIEQSSLAPRSKQLLGMLAGGALLAAAGLAAKKMYQPEVIPPIYADRRRLYGNLRDEGNATPLEKATMIQGMNLSILRNLHDGYLEEVQSKRGKPGYRDAHFEYRQAIKTVFSPSMRLPEICCPNWTQIIDNLGIAIAQFPPDSPEALALGQIIKDMADASSTKRFTAEEQLMQPFFHFSNAAANGA